MPVEAHWPVEMRRTQTQPANMDCSQQQRHLVAPTVLGSVQMVSEEAGHQTSQLIFYNDCTKNLLNQFQHC